MNSIEQLVAHFKRFPGVGPRQARRFAMHLLTEREEDNATLSALIRDLHTSIAPCTACMRFVSSREMRGLCRICADENRDSSTLLVVAHDSDIAAIERADEYDGKYFVFGGTIALLDAAAHGKVRAGQLRTRIEAEKDTLSELILAFPANPDGDNTARYISEHLVADILAHTPSLTVTHLGRGLSTGSELEYADPDTITFAIRNRK